MTADSSAPRSRISDRILSILLLAAPLASCAASHSEANRANDAGSDADVDSDADSDTDSDTDTDSRADAGADSGPALDAGPCRGRLERCDGECVDTRRDLRHCGTCGNACDPSQALECRDGRCECGGEAACAGTEVATCCPSGATAACVDLTANLSHWNCGGCGIACSDDEYCERGTCTECASGPACGAEGLARCPIYSFCVLGCCHDEL